MKNLIIERFERRGGDLDDDDMQGGPVTISWQACREAFGIKAFGSVFQIVNALSKRAFFGVERLFESPRSKQFAAAIMLGLSTILFWRAMRQAFVGDDFVWLYNAEYNMKYLHGWMTAFDQMNGSGFYRPLSQQIFFYVMFHLFGMNAYLMHVAVFTVYLITAFVLYKLLLLLCEDTHSAIAGTAVFLFSSVNYVGLSWLAAFSQTGSTLFFVATLYLYASNRRLPSYMAFLFCLLSGEITSTIPAFICLYEFIIRRSSVVRAFLHGSAFWVMLVTYVVLRLLVLGIRPAGPFGMANSLILVWTTFTDSFAWMGGWTPTFHRALGYPRWRVIGWVSSTLLAISVAASLVTLGLTDRRAASVRLVVTGLLWAVIGMSPVLLFSLHDYAAYTLAISLIGFALFVAGAVANLDKNSGRLLSCLIVIATFGVNFVAIYNPGGSNQTEGSNFYGKLARAYAASIRQCTVHDNFDTVYIVGGNDALRWALGDQWGARMIAQNPVIKMSYVSSVVDADRSGLVLDYTKNKLSLVSCGTPAQAQRGGRG